MYAIIETGGKQIKVTEGEIVYIEKLDVNADDTVTFDRVLACGTFCVRPARRLFFSSDARIPFRRVPVVASEATFFCIAAGCVFAQRTAACGAFIPPRRAAAARIRTALR